eukprot:UN10228
MFSNHISFSRITFPLESNSDDYFRCFHSGMVTLVISTIATTGRIGVTQVPTLVEYGQVVLAVADRENSILKQMIRAQTGFGMNEQERPFLLAQTSQFNDRKRGDVGEVAKPRLLR